MKGNLLFERDQNWDMALMNFKSARCILVYINKQTSTIAILSSEMCMLTYTIAALLSETSLFLKIHLINYGFNME